MSIGILVTAVVIFAVIELLIVKFNGTAVPVPTIPRDPEIYGSGQPLVYVVMGDSTAVGQGGDYDKGIARSTARHLAELASRQVTLRNLGVAGARAGGVAKHQLPKATQLRPDVVLIAVGANDVTHLTPTGSVSRDMSAVIDALRAANPDVRIVLTGSPEMGSIPRFPQPMRYFAGVRTGQVNAMLADVARDKQVVLAPIARITGPIFDRNPDLFAADKFHPTTEGYAVWLPTLEWALAVAMGR